MRQILAILGVVLSILFFSALSKGDRLVALVCAVGAVACFAPILKRMREIDNERKQTQNTARQLAYDSAQKELALFEGSSKFKELPDLSDQVRSIVLEPSETCVLVSRNAQRIVTRERTRYVGQTAGVSLKISKNLHVRTGGFRGEPVKTSYTEAADTGTLYLTDHRFMFAGHNEVVTVPLSKIASVRDDEDMVEVIQENHARPVMIKISEQFRPPVITAATLAMARRAVSRKGHKGS
jgi:hypothetical protein